MKVVKPGRAQKGWAGTFKCTGAGNGDGGCGAELLVEDGDVYQTERNCRDETDYFKTFRCVSCGVETDLDDKRGYGCTPKGNRPRGQCAKRSSMMSRLWECSHE